MAEPANKPKPRLRRRIFALVGVLLLVALYFLHGPLMERGLRAALISAAKSGGFNLELGDVSWSVWQPLILRDLNLRHADPSISRTSAQLALIRVDFHWPTAFFGTKGRLFRSILLEDGWIILDQHTGAPPTRQPMRRLDENAQRREAGTIRWFLPSRLAWQDIQFELLSDTVTFSLGNSSAVFDESELGHFHASGMELRFGKVRQVFAAQKGVTAWKNGELFLAEATLRNGMVIENLSVQLTRPGGVSLDLNAEVFGGSLRGGAFFGELRGEPGVDAAVWASGVDFEQASDFLGLEPQAGGRLEEGRFTYRGNPGRALDAEASLRLSAKDFRLEERGWESLELSASLINRRLSVGEFQLRQQENQLTGNGEVALAGDWKDTAQSPFLLNLSADLRDISSLAALLGEPLDQVSGRMTVSAMLSGRAKKVDGFVSMEASAIEYRGRTFESATAEVVLKEGEARVEKLQVWSEGDFLSGRGAVGLEAPHLYNAHLQARIGDIGKYAELAQTPLPFTSGGLDLAWEGDGNRSSHSGAFESKLTRLITEWTPGGISGEFSGTYSPGNIHFGEMQLRHGPARLSLTATLAESGIRLDDVSLLQNRKEIASGEFFLPVNPFLLLQQKSLPEAVVAGKSVHARLVSDGMVSVRDLSALFGLSPVAQGNIQAEIHASGPVEALAVQGTLSGRDLKPIQGGAPPSSLELTANAANGTAQISGRLVPKGFQPLTISGSIPFGFGTSEDGIPYLVNPRGQLQGRIELPGTALGSLQPVLPGIQRASGTLSGAVNVSGSPASPRLDGKLTVREGALNFSAQAPDLTKMNGEILFSGDRLEIPGITAEAGAGPVRLSGSVSFADPGNPVYDLRLEGSQVLLYRGTDARIRADVNLAARGSNTGGRLEGSIRIVDGRIFRRLEITPFIAPTPAQEAQPFTPPVVTNLVPPPFDAWNVDVQIINKTPFLIVGDVASGEVVPDLRLSGNLGSPFPTGSIALFGARAFLPLTTMTIRQGMITFTEAMPWMPVLDVQGVAETLDYDIRLQATGPLSEASLSLRSDPPLPQESIILLLTTGIAPGQHSGAGFGEVAIGQTGMILLRSLLRQFRFEGIDTESLLDRLQVSAVPPQLPGGSAGMRARLNLYRGFSIMSEQDDLGFFNVGASYRFRFR